jgi:hypothetical protein
MPSQSKLSLLMLFVAVGCSHADGATGNAGATPVEAAEAAPSSAFSWAPARSAADAAPEEFPARLLNTPGTNAVIVPPLPARVVDILVKPGDTVVKGAPIARVVMPDADGAAAQLQAADRALAVLAQRKTQLSELQGEGLVRAADVAALDLEIARLNGEKLRARAVLAGSGVGGGGVIVLRSQIAGVITDVQATLGEYRRPEDGPLAHVRSRTGQRIEATFSSVPAADANYTFAAGGAPVALKFINSMPATSGVGYVAWFDAAQATEIPSSAQGRVMVQAPTSADTWVVPATAVGHANGGAFLIIRLRDAAAATQLPVTLVRIANADALVRGPVPTGAVVASDAVRAEALLLPAGTAP